MKNFLIFIIIVVGFIAVYNLRSDDPRKNVDTSEIPNEVIQDPDSVIQYITQNISELSPEEAPVGGTFFVTNITLDSGSGVVEYEDGRIALTARFDYSYTKDGEVVINNFTLVE